MGVDWRVWERCKESWESTKPSSRERLLRLCSRILPRASTKGVMKGLPRVKVFERERRECTEGSSSSGALAGMGGALQVTGVA